MSKFKSFSEKKNQKLATKEKMNELQSVTAVPCGQKKKRRNLTCDVIHQMNFVDPFDIRYKMSHN